jgi:hypothetical protein
MYRLLFPGVLIGFAISCVGIVSRTYMDFSAHGRKMFTDFQRGNNQVNYWRRFKQRRASVWPFFVSIVCIPVGIIIVFGSIIWSNQFR